MPQPDATEPSRGPTWLAPEATDEPRRRDATARRAAKPPRLEAGRMPRRSRTPAAPEPRPTTGHRPRRTADRRAGRSPMRCAPPASGSRSRCPVRSFLGVLDAFEGAGIRVVATRHEGGAAFMAEAYGQLTGRPAACLGTRAVGASNLAIGIHTARQDSTPMFALVGQVQREFLGREAFQEIDQVATLGGLAKWAAQPMTAEEIPAVMAEAVRQALGGRPGTGPAGRSPRTSSTRSPPSAGPAAQPRAGAARASEPEIRSVLNLLAGAERPVILAGAGVLRARTSTELSEVRRTAPRAGDRVVAARRRHLERPPAVPGHGRARRPGGRPRAAGLGRRGPRPRFTAQRGDILLVHAAGRRAPAGSTWTSSRADRPACRPPSASSPRMPAPS